MGAQSRQPVARVPVPVCSEQLAETRVSRQWGEWQGAEQKGKTNQIPGSPCDPAALAALSPVLPGCRPAWHAPRVSLLRAGAEAGGSLVRVTSVGTLLSVGLASGWGS